jgi:putative heme-binding domain-containing protein
MRGRDLVAVFCLGLCVLGGSVFAQDDDAQKAKDARVVKALLRIKEEIDFSAKPDAKAALLRHVARLENADEQVDLIERFKLAEAADLLAKTAIGGGDSSSAANAARLLIGFGKVEVLAAVLKGADDKKAIQAAYVLSNAGNDKVADELLTPVFDDEERAPEVRNAAAAGVARSKAGQEKLLELAREGKLPDFAKVTVAVALSKSQIDAIRTEAAKLLPLPATGDGKPLPPITELLQRTGDVAKGKVLFEEKGTCAKCHQVRGQGKEVGPNLSEIGSKLARDAMYTSILDPSAGISHNYETFQVVLDDGTQATGLMVSDTAEEVAIKTAEGVVRKFPKGEIEEVVKLKTSIMPNDLLRTLTADDLVDLVEYLVSLKKM